MEQLMLSTQVIMMLAHPGGLGAALTQAGLQKQPTGQPEASNGAVSPAQVHKWGNDLKATRPEPPHVPIADRPPAEFVPQPASVDGDPE